MKRAGAALVLALLATSCSTSRAPVPPPTPGPVIVTPVSGQAMSPRTYVTTSSSFEQYVLRAAELADSRARDPRVRAQARAELADHRGLSAQLSFAGRNLNLLPPRAMGEADAARLVQLEGSSDYDSLFKERMIAAHDHQYKVNRDVAERGSSPTLRPIARNAATVLARHLDQLRAL